MKKAHSVPQTNEGTKKGYNEKNPGQPEGAFTPAAAEHQLPKEDTKSNAADKKKKEDGTK